MGFLPRVASPLIALALIAGAARAQGLTPGVTKFSTIAFPATQEELKLSQKQVGEVLAFSKEYVDRMAEDGKKLGPGLSPDFLEKARRLDDARTSWGMAKLAAILRPEQFERFKQIELQDRGIDAFVAPEIAKQLSITAEQSAKIEAFRAEAKAEIARLRQTTKGLEFVTKALKAQKDAAGKARAVLDARQAKLWAEMTGEPFSVHKLP